MGKIIGGEFAIEINSLPYVTIENNRMLYSSGRCALYLILKDIETKLGNNLEILLPNYLCDSISKTVIDAGWSYKFYSIGVDLYPDWEEILSYNQDNNAIVLLINYFGMINLEPIVLNIKRNMPNTIIIVDNVQAFFEPEIEMVDYTFTSYRKWFPCPDGASVTKRNNEKMLMYPLKNNTFSKYKFAGNLLKNFTAYLGDDISLKLINEGEGILDEDYLCWGSRITTTIIPTLDLKKISEKRKNNARILHEKLEKMSISHVYREQATPLFIPIFVDNRDNIRKLFFENKVFTPKHWPYISEKINGNNKIYDTELSLICDQRYDEEDMLFQINVLKQIV